MSNFDAHDLKKAFEDGVMAERQRLLELLRKKIITENSTDNAKLEYAYYVKLFNGIDHVDFKTL